MPSARLLPFATVGTGIPLWVSVPGAVVVLAVAARACAHRSLCAAGWVVTNVTRQLDVITSHIHTHQGALDRLPGEQRAMIEEASATVRHVRRAVPVAFGPTRRPTTPPHCSGPGAARARPSAGGHLPPCRQ